MKSTLALCAIGALTTGSLADLYIGGGGAIPDNGGPGNQFSSNIVVGDSGSLTDLDMNINLSHTWAGDLIITLQHMDTGTSVVLENRVGLSGSLLAGFSWNLAGNYTFDDAAATTWFDFGNPGSTVVLPNGSYRGAAALSAFNGEDVMGTWRLTVSDNAGLDQGSVGSWGINATFVPAPGAVALLGMGGLAATRRRRA